MTSTESKAFELEQMVTEMKKEFLCLQHCFQFLILIILVMNVNVLYFVYFSGETVEEKKISCSDDGLYWVIAKDAPGADIYFLILTLLSQLPVG